ncbi:hypothetical protein ASF52_16580 [Methylobacterium sp. Leaf112]|nr:hypothetical protein ASF52_16580 [Methylobacterium sp. Leaf112]
MRLAVPPVPDCVAVMAASLVFACTAVTRFGVAALVPVWVTVMELAALAVSWLVVSWLPNSD